jgi:hypothetical protein
MHIPTTSHSTSTDMKKTAKKPTAKVKDLKPKKNPKGGLFARKAGGKQEDY